LSHINGTEVDATATDKFTGPRFNAAGGEGYPALSVINTGNVDADVMYSYLDALDTVQVSNDDPLGESVYTNSDSPL
ncbi:bifunctional UDP-sugar hydrolase/5'-nucleotidase, partial [Vibrio parahaemolyticus]|nr:bifunctional UDP-sugar hydrolase/5'-nucleotidase [Vibrio parahaemolyticus]